MGEWLYEKETERIIGLLYQVRNEIGGGWSEEIYHQALVYYLGKNDIPSESKPRRHFMHRDVLIHTFEPDIIVWDKIILELKVLLNHKGRNFPSENQRQILHYLKFHQMSLGILVNFAHSKVGVRRMIYEEKEVEIEENYERMLPYVTEADRVVLRKVQRHIKSVARQYGLGYSESFYRKLVAVELVHQGIDCVSDVSVKAVLGDEVLGMQRTSCLLVDGRFLIHIRAMLEGVPAHDFIQARTFLQALGLKVGWVINFGRTQLQIHATVTK